MDWKLEDPPNAWSVFPHGIVAIFQTGVWKDWVTEMKARRKKIPPSLMVLKTKDA